MRFFLLTILSSLQIIVATANANPNPSRNGKLVPTHEQKRYGEIPNPPMESKLLRMEFDKASPFMSLVNAKQNAIYEYSQDNFKTILGEMVGLEKFIPIPMKDNQSISIREKDNHLTVTTAKIISVEKNFAYIASSSLTPASVCSGESVTGSVTIFTTVGGPFTYDCTLTSALGSQTLTGVAAGTHSFAPVQMINMGATDVATQFDFSVTEQGAGASATVFTDSRNVNTRPLPTPAITPTSSTVCNGENVTLTGSVPVFPTVTWTITPSSGLSGVTGLSASSNVYSGTAGNTTGETKSGTVAFTAQYATGKACATTTSASLTVKSPPVISANPDNTIVCEGSTAPFSVTASGSDVLSYTWYKNGASVGTGNPYTTPATVAADNNAVYKVVVTNTCTSVSPNTDVTSSDAILTVISTPVTSAPTATESICGGTSPTGTTAALPGANYAYLIDAVASGAGTATAFTATQTSVGGSVDIESASIANVSGDDATVTYNVRLYSFGPDGMDDLGLGDDCVDATAETFVVTVKPTPVIDPVSTVSVCALEPISIPTNDNIAGVSTDYTWSGGATVGIADGTGSGMAAVNITGTALANNTGAGITATLTVAATSNGCSSNPDLTFNVVLKPTPVIDAIANEMHCSGYAISIPVSDNTGSASTVYTISGGADIGIADGTVTGSGTNITGTTPQNNTGVDITRTVTVTASLNGCDYSSETFDFTLKANPTVTLAQVETVCTNTAAEIQTTGLASILANGLTATYQIDGVGPLTASVTDPSGIFNTRDLVNADDNKNIELLSITDVAEGCTMTYSTLPSATLDVNVVDAGTIVNLLPATVCKGYDPDDTFLNLSGATGTGLTYQWQHSTNNVAYLTASDSQSGATTTTLDIDLGLITDLGVNYYRVKVESTVGANTCTVYSNTVTTTAVEKADIPTIATSAPAVCELGDVTLSATPTTLTGGIGPLTYQWESSSDAGVTWNPLSTLASPSYTFTATDALSFRLSVVDPGSGCEGIFSTDETVSVNFIDEISTPQDITVCSKAFFDVNAIDVITDPSATVTYSWERSTSPTFATSTPEGITNELLGISVENVSASPVVYYYRRTAISDLSGVTCTDNSFVTTVTVSSEPVTADKVKMTAVCSDVTIGDMPASDSGAPTEFYRLVSITIPVGVTANTANYDVVQGGAPIDGVTSDDLKGDKYTNTTNGTLSVIYTLVPFGPDPNLIGCEGAQFTYTIPISPSITASTAITQLNGVNCTGTEAEIRIPGMATNMFSRDLVATYAIGAAADVTASITQVGATTEGKFLTTVLTNANDGEVLTLKKIADPVSGCELTMNADVTLDVNKVTIGALTETLPVTACNGYDPAPAEIQVASVTSDGDTGVGNSTTFIWEHSVGAGAYGPADINGIPTLSPDLNQITTDGLNHYRLNVISIVNGVVCEATSATTADISINPQVSVPDITASAAVVCSGQTATLSVAALNANQGVNPVYSWHAATDNFGTPGTYGASLGAGANYTTAPLTEDTWFIASVTNTANVGCNNVQSLDKLVTVNNIHYDVTVTNSADDDITVCSRESFTLQPLLDADDSNAATFVWEHSLNSDMSSPTASTPAPISTTDYSFDAIDGVSNITNAPVNHYYRVTATSVVGGVTCTDASRIIKVTVNPEPVIANVTPDATVCSDLTINVAVPNTDTDGGAITKYDISNNYASVASATFSGTATPLTIGTSNFNLIKGDIFTNTGTSDVTVTYTVTPYMGTCAGADFTINVVVSPEPVVASSTETTVCSDAVVGVTLSAGSSAPATAWNLTAITTTGLTASVGATNQAIADDLLANALSNDKWNNISSGQLNAVYTITPKIAATGCLGDSYMVTVPINPEPVATVTNGGQNICSNTAMATMVLGTNNAPAGSLAGTTYAWTRSNTMDITGLATNGTTNISGTPRNITGMDQVAVITITPTGPTPSSCSGDDITANITVKSEPTGAKSTVQVCTNTNVNISLQGNIDATTASAGLVAYSANTTHSLNASGGGFGNAMSGTTFSWKTVLPFFVDYDNGTPYTGGTTVTGTSSSITGAFTNNSIAVQTVTFSVTPTAANGCVGEPFNVVVKVNGTPQIGSTPNGDLTLCVNEARTLSATTIGGKSPLTYTWSATHSGGAAGTLVTSSMQSPTYTGTAAGTVSFNVTVTDGNGCQAVADPALDFVINAEPTLTLTPVSVSCYGGNDGKIIAVGGTTPTPYTYQLNIAGFVASNNTPASTNHTFTALAPNPYTVTVKDGNGCTVATNTIVTQPTALSSSVTATTNVSCKGGNDGAVTITTTGGTTAVPSVYTIAPTPSALVAGTYIFTVTDDKGCSTTTIAFVSEPAVALSATAVPTASAGCDITSNNGAATVTATGGTSPYVLTSSTGTVSGMDVTGLTAGTHTLTVTDAKNCTATVDVTITNNLVTAGTINAFPVTTACVGYDPAAGLLSVTGASGSGTLEYLWEFDLNASNVFASAASAAGTTGSEAAVDLNEITDIGLNKYRVRVRSIDGASQCDAYTNIVSVTIVPDATVSIVSVSPSVVCPGSDVTLTATSSGTGITPSYTWESSLDDGALDPYVNVGTGLTVTTTGGLVENTYFRAVLSDDASLGCNNEVTAPFEVTVNNINEDLNPTASINPACSDEAFEIQAFDAFADGTITYSWSRSTDINMAGAIVMGTDNVLTVTAGITNITSAPISYYYQRTTTSVLSGVTCTATSGIAQIDINPKPVMAVIPDVTVCNGAISNVTLPTIASNGLSIGTYTITNIVATGATKVSGASISDSGNETLIKNDIYTSTNGGTVVYTITPQSVDGCTGSSFTVKTVINAVLSASATQDVSVSCKGASTGVATVVPVGGTGSYTYLWSNGQTLATATGLAAGTYSVTVNDGNCTTIASVTITEPASTITAIANSNGSAPLCLGSSRVLNSFAFGGTGTLTYAWSVTGVTGTFSPSTSATPSFSATTSGVATITLTVMDANLCSVSATPFTITVPSAVTVTAGVPVNVSCKGGSNGSVVITPTGGTAPYTISPSQTGLVAGTYTFTATDANGCTGTVSATITEPAAVTATVVVTNVTCKGGSNGSVLVTPTGGTAPYTITPSQTGLLAGTYVFTVTDGNGCTGTVSATVTEPAAVTATAVVTNVSCKGGSNGSVVVTPTGGTGSYTITPSQTGLAAGTYTFTISDANSCTGTVVATVTEPAAALGATATSTNVLCKGGSTGTAVISASGGTGTYTYLWSNGATTASISGLVANTYTATVTDANLCTKTASVTVTEPTDITASAAAGTIACFGGSTSITVTATGGTAPLQYSNNGGAYQSSNVFTGNVAGSYTITVKDANNCLATATSSPLVITQPAVLSGSITSQTNVSCKGGSNGSVVVTPTGGTAPYTITPSQTGLLAGTYVFTVTDGNGCTGTVSATVTEPAAVTATAVVTNVSCKGGSNGSVVVTPTGGTGSYTITPSQTGLAAGTYTFTISDANSCTGTVVATVTEPAAALGATATSTNVLCKGGSTGTAVISASGGTGTYTYLWSNGATTASISGLVANTYTATVTDANLCTKTASVTVTEPTDITASAAAGTIACFGGSTSITVTATGGTAPLQYSNNGGAYQSSNVFTGNVAGSYTITVKDANNCLATATSSPLVITQPAVLSGSITSQTNVSCKGGSNGSVVVTPTGGTAPYTITPSQTGLLAGTYVFTVTDGNGCTGTVSATVTEPAAVTATAVVTNVSCKGGSNGSVVVTPAGGTGSYTITPSQTGLAAGTYTFTISDANSCTGTVVATVTEPAAALGATATSTNVLCKGGSTGTAVVSASGGTGTYTYLWSNGATTASISGLVANTYTATVTDANLCTKTASVTVTEPTDITASAAAGTIACFGGSTSITVTATGGTAPLQYSNNGGAYQSSNVFTGNVAGSYTITVKDANNCLATATSSPLVITQPAVLSGSITSQTNVSCKGGSNGSVVVTPTGGTAPYTITPSQTGLLSGTYVFTVTDANSCVTTVNATITEPAAVLVATGVMTASSGCVGQSNGIAVVSPTGGTAPYTISPAQTGLSAGVHTFTVTDANLCTTTTDVTITENSIAVGAITSTLATSACVGYDPAAGTLSIPVVTPLSGGTIEYRWLHSTDGTNYIDASADGVTGSTNSVDLNGITDLSINYYKVEVKSIVGASTCSSSSSVVEITINSDVSISITSATPSGVVCSGTPVTLTATTTGTGIGPFSYTWLDASTNAVVGTGLTTTITATDDASYVVTVTDNASLGCNNEISLPYDITVNKVEEDQFIAATNNPVCSGEVFDVNANDASAPSSATISYVWNRSTDSGMASPTQVGTSNLLVGESILNTTSTYVTYYYQRTTTSELSGVSCTATTNITSVDVNPAPIVLSPMDITICNGVAYGLDLPSSTNGVTVDNYTIDNIVITGTATAAVGNKGIGDSGAATLIKNNSYTSASGATVVYTITPRSIDGCAGASFTVTTVINATLSAIVSSQVNVLCKGAATGSVVITTTGGVAPIVITPAQTGLVAGSYTFTVTDANSCSTTVSATITEPASAISVIANANGTSTLCQGDTRVFNSFALGGTGTLKYSWSASAGSLTNETTATPTYTSSTAGSITVTLTVTDDNTCSQSSSFVINVNSAPSFTTTLTDVNCFGGNDGKIAITATGGSGSGYEYKLNSNPYSTVNPITGLAPGTYTLTVKDGLGCTSSATVTINQPTAAISAPIASQTNVKCNGMSTGSVTLAPAGGTGVLTVSATSGTVTGYTVSGLAAGTYNISVTDSKGCVFSVPVTITEPTLLGLTIASKTDILCHGANTGTAILSATGGTTPYSYTWSNGQTTLNATSLVAGVYSATVTDANGCFANTSVTITEPSQITLNYTVTDVLCFGDINGSISMSASGGVPPYEYRKGTIPGFSGITMFDHLAAGVYTMYVKDANACIVPIDVTVGSPAVLAATASGTNETCNELDNGTATVAVTGGTMPYDYAWSNGATTQSISSLVAGSYSVTVTDANSCSTTSSYTVTQPDVLAATASGTNETCNELDNGTATVAVTGGTMSYGYAWSNGATTQSISGLAAGNYTVTVTDANSCSTTSSYTVTQPDVLAATASGTNETCNELDNGTATVAATGGTISYSYAWSNGATTQSISGLAAGNYTVTVTDANSCSTTSSYTVTQPDVLAATASGTNETCNELDNGTATVAVTGGTMSYSYAWSNGATTQSISGLAAGNYTVTVTDANSCSTTSSYTVTQPDVLAATASGTNETCNELDNGTATVAVTGGTMSYSYAWSNGATTQSISGLAAGNYTVTVTDANSCSTTSSYTVTQPDVLAATASGTNETCNELDNGTATVAVTGGTMSYSYAWSNGATTQSISGLAAGNYTVTVTDANSCSTTSSYTVTQPDVLAATASGTNETCNELDNGTATVAVTGGTMSYSYAWSNGATTQSISGLAAGNYTVTVTDANSCSTTSSYTVTQPDVLAATASGTNETCNELDNGTATVAVTGGTMSYSYAWSNGATTQSISGLAAGNYTVTVTDANSCSTTSSYTVTQPDVLAATASGTNETCNELDNGTATVAATGGTISYSYAWSNGATTQSISGLAAGNYTVTVTDANSCSTTSSYTVTQPDVLAATASGTNETCNELDNGTATVAVTGGTMSYSYAWSNGATTQSISGLAAGNYTVTVTDANSCSTTSSYTVTQPDVLAATASGTNETCNELDNGTATVAVTGGTMSYSYAWSNGATTQSISGLAAGNYTVTVTDANSCSTTSSYTVTQPDVLAATASGTNETCNELDNGTATVAVTGGTMSYSYAWSNGATTQSISGLAAGNYTVTVTDANSCSTTSSYTVTQPDVLAATASGTNETCNELDNGTATVAVTGGTMSYSYAWSNGATTQSISGLAAGNYTVTVTDANSCSTTSSYTVTQPDVLAATITPDHVTCHGGSNGSATANPTGGTMPYNYSWSNGVNTVTITGIAAGSYTVTVTDANGCSTTATTTITQPNTIADVTTSQCSDVALGINLPVGYAASYKIASINMNGLTPDSGNSTASTASTVSMTAIANDKFTNITAGNVDVVYTIIPISAGPNSCEGTPFTVTATINPEPYGVASTINRCSGEPFSFNHNVLTNALVGTTYRWTLNSDVNPVFITPSLPNPTTVFGPATDITGNWVNNGANPATVTYTITPTSASGCPGTPFTVGIVLVGRPNVAIFTSLGTSPMCTGDSRSLITVVSGGSGSYTYNWGAVYSNGANGSLDDATATSPVFTSLAPGKVRFTLTLTDGGGCTSVSNNVDITINALPSISLTKTDVSCFGANTGQIVATGSGGTGVYQYRNGTNPYQVSGTFSNLAPGIYTIEVKDGNLCTATATETVIQPQAPITTVVSSQMNICPGGSTGSVTFSTTGGTPTYTYNANAGTVSGNTISGLIAGSYNVTITDSKGCTAVIPVTITQPAPLALSLVSSTNPVCNGSNTGSITLSATGGTPQYSYTYGATTQNTGTFTGLAAGTYSFTLSDASGCVASTPVDVTLIDPAALTPTFASPVLTVQQGTSATYTLSTTYSNYVWSIGGTATVTSGANSSSNFVSFNFPNSENVPVSVTVTDANGCKGVADITIQVVPYVLVSPKVQLQGAFTASTGLMTDRLRTLSLIPTAQPYTVTPRFTQVNNAGTETVNPSVLATTGNDAIVDWVFIQLRDASNNATVVSTRSALLQRDGDVVDVDGVSPVKMYVPFGTSNFFVTVKHRNHLGVMTAATVALNSATGTTVNFTSSATATYGTDAQTAIAGTGAQTGVTTMVMRAGNANGMGTNAGNRNVRVSGLFNDDAIVLAKVGATTPTNIVAGYNVEDLNLDGQVRYQGLFNDKAVILITVGAATPTNIAVEQTPN